MVRKKREKREIERDVVVVGEEGGIFCWGFGLGGRGVGGGYLLVIWCCCWFERGVRR